jgi:hypothetical protein
MARLFNVVEAKKGLKYVIDSIEQALNSTFSLK